MDELIAYGLGFISGVTAFAAFALTRLLNTSNNMLKLNSRMIQNVVKALDPDHEYTPIGHHDGPCAACGGDADDHA